jgi:hypothetical protein
MHNANNVFIGELRCGWLHVLQRPLAPVLEFGGGLFSSEFSRRDQNLHLARGNDKRSGTAMARDGYRLSLHGIEQLPKLVLRFGGSFGNHGSLPDIPIIAILAKMAIPQELRWEHREKPSLDAKGVAGEVHISIVSVCGLFLEDL